MTSPGRRARDWQQIRELRSRYARAIDHKNWEEAHEIFTEDATVHYRGGPLTGAQEVEDYWRENVHYEYSMHTMQAPVIDIDGDTASGEWYLLEYYVMPDGTDGFCFGWYEDEYRRVDGDWYISYLDMAVEEDTEGVHGGT
jgi:hypothetical protein